LAAAAVVVEIEACRFGWWQVAAAPERWTSGTSLDLEHGLGRMWRPPTDPHLILNTPTITIIAGLKRPNPLLRLSYHRLSLFQLLQLCSFSFLLASLRDGRTQSTSA